MLFSGLADTFVFRYLYFVFINRNSYICDLTLQEMKLGWRIIVGSIVGFLGAALGSVGGVGGGGIYVPMLTLIIGFDAKSSTALSKCNITQLTLL